MKRKEYFLIGMAVLLAGWYVVFFSDWFKPKYIHIEHSVRAAREAWTGNGRRAAPAAGVGGVTFALQKPYRLTSVRVVLRAEVETNKFAHPLWHLVSKSGSDPADGFAYGYPISGMMTEVAGAEPEPLQPGTEYQLLIEAGSLKGTNNFTLENKIVSRQ